MVWILRKKGALKPKAVNVIQLDVLKLTQT